MRQWIVPLRMVSCFIVRFMNELIFFNCIQTQQYKWIGEHVTIQMEEWRVYFIVFYCSGRYVCVESDDVCVLLFLSCFVVVAIGTFCVDLKDLCVLLFCILWFYMIELLNCMIELLTPRPYPRHCSRHCHCFRHHCCPRCEWNISGTEVVPIGDQCYTWVSHGLVWRMNIWLAVIQFCLAVRENRAHCPVRTTNCVSTEPVLVSLCLAIES